jgi:hypothetical protein
LLLAPAADPPVFELSSDFTGRGAQASNAILSPRSAAPL